MEVMKNVANMRLTLHWVGHHCENEYYCNDDILMEFSLLGFQDETWKNEECPHFELELDNEWFLQVWLKSSYSEFDFQANNHSISLGKGEDSRDEQIFCDPDIWVIWSLIRSNLPYFNGFGKDPNPYSDWSEDSIGDELFELKEWMVDNYLSSGSHDPVDTQDGSISVIDKYNMLQDAMEKLNEKGSK